MSKSYNKGEWSELYAFVKLIKEGRIYAADEDVNKIDDVYLPIIKLIRNEKGTEYDYFTGDIIEIYKDGHKVKEMPIDVFEDTARTMYDKIFEGAGNTNKKGAFEIPEIASFMEESCIGHVKANSTEKVDMEMQIRDIHTGYSPEVGFSIKSDVGSAPTLLNAGKNTRFVYRIRGLSDDDANYINSITKDVEKNYMKARMTELKNSCEQIEYYRMKDAKYEDNLMLVDSWLPRIFGEMILKHYMLIDQKIYDCKTLVQLVAQDNPLQLRRSLMYEYKFKKMLVASALGMTPGKEWTGQEDANGGYIIIRKDGEVLCYHLYNRNFFEDYLLDNTAFDRPSASRHDYGYIYENNNEKYVDLNVQIRFK